MMKYNKPITIKQAAVMLGTTHRVFYEWLRKNGIMLRTNRYNIPADRFIREKWFEIDSVRVENSGFDSVVPKIRMTTKGFEKIKEKFEENMRNFNLCFERALLETLYFENIEAGSLKSKIKANGDEVLYFKNKIILTGNFITYKIWRNSN